VQPALATIELETLPRTTLSKLDFLLDLPTMIVSHPKRDAVWRMTLSGSPDSTIARTSAPAFSALARAVSIFALDSSRFPSRVTTDSTMSCSPYTLAFLMA
jgi:hypothetical protein